MTDADVTRRRLLQGAAGLTVAAAARPAVAQSDGPEFGGWFDNVGNYDGMVDETGSDEVTVSVGAEANGGAFGFGPAAVEVSPGTTVVWEWTGSGGSHNVVAEDGTFESELTKESGHTFEYTFEETGTYKYACTPHRSMGMKGAVVVSEGDSSGTETAQSEESGGSDPDFGGWFDNVGNYDGVVDETGSDEVTVSVGADANGGAFGFDPAAVEVSPGTTVVWEWTGSGGSHNVVAEDGTFESELTKESGHTFEYTFEESGTYEYACTPHRSMGMKGAVVVSEASSGASGDGGGESGGGSGGSGGDPFSPGASALGISLLIAFLSPLGLAAFLRRRGADEPGSGGRPRAGD